MLNAFDTFAASTVDGGFIGDAYLFLECEHFKTVDGFGDNALVTGRIVAAQADRQALRSSDQDDQELIHDSPLLAFLPPGRFATIEQSNAFPFHNLHLWIHRSFVDQILQTILDFPVDCQVLLSYLSP